MTQSIRSPRRREQIWWPARRACPFAVLRLSTVSYLVGAWTSNGTRFCSLASSSQFPKAYYNNVRLSKLSRCQIGEFKPVAINANGSRGDVLRKGLRGAYRREHRGPVRRSRLLPVKHSPTWQGLPDPVRATNRAMPATGAILRMKLKFSLSYRVASIASGEPQRRSV